MIEFKDANTGRVKVHRVDSRHQETRRRRRLQCALAEASHHTRALREAATGATND